jgi:hypothetical protein
MQNRDIMEKCVRAVRSSLTPEQNTTAKRYCVLALRRVYGEPIPEISQYLKQVKKGGEDAGQSL